MNNKAKIFLPIALLVSLGGAIFMIIRKLKGGQDK